MTSDIGANQTGTVPWRRARCRVIMRATNQLEVISVDGDTTLGPSPDVTKYWTPTDWEKSVEVTAMATASTLLVKSWTTAMAPRAKSNQLSEGASEIRPCR